MRRKFQKLAVILIALGFLFGTRLSAQATDGIEIIEKFTTEDGIVLYIKGIERVDEASYQIGTTACTIESICSVQETEDPIYTLILWDNSVSVMKKYADQIKDILLNLVASRTGGEKFSIAQMGNELTYLTDYGNDYAVLKQVIEDMPSEDKEVYIVDNLYMAIEELNRIPDAGYKRLIIISDGMGNTTTGYTDKELADLINKTPYPIYTIGIESKNDAGGLQNLFAISRSTYGEYFNLNEVEDNMTVVQALGSDYGFLCVWADIPREIQDGSIQNSQLTLVSGSETYAVQSQVALPFMRINEEETKPETEESEILPEENPQEAVEEERQSVSIPWWIIGIAAGIVVILLILCIIVLHKKKGKKEPARHDYEKLDKRIKNERTEKKESEKDAIKEVSTAGAVHTEIVRNTAGQTNGKKTQLLFAETAEETETGKRLILTDAADPIRVYQCNIKDKIIVGRNPSCCNLAIARDNAVSEKHCEISREQDRLYIKDLNSSNGTYVNENRIHAVTELKEGSIVKIGRAEYKVKVE